MNQVGHRQFQLEDGSRRTKDEKSSRRTKNIRFIVELKDRAMNRILSLCVKVENKSSAFGIREILGRREDLFCLSPYGRAVEVRLRPTWSMIVIRFYKKKSFSIHHSG